MDIAFISVAAVLTAIVTAASWLGLKIATGSTKYAWALALALGYTIGHISLVASFGFTAETFGEKFSEWLAAWPTAAYAVAKPAQAIDWLPIGALLAGLVTVNAAVFGFEKLITWVGGCLISVLLVIELSGSNIADTTALFSWNAGLPVLLGIVAIWGAWISLNQTIDDRSRWTWISSVAALTTAAVLVMWLAGANEFALLGIIIFAAVLGGTSVSLVGSGTNNARYSGAVVAAASVGLLLSAWWFSDLAWYPVAILFLGFVSVGCWLPSVVYKIPHARISVSVICSVAAVLVAAFVK